LHLDRGVPKEIKKKVKYLKKAESTYCCKGQVLVYIWRENRNIKLILTVECVETEKKNQNGETTKKPEIIQDNKKFMEAWRGQTKFCTITHAAGKL
jgi:Rieske Fe-S protein